MKKISLFKKIKLFRQYKKIVKTLREELWSDFAARIDNAYRIYTVLNINPEDIGEAYDLKKSDIDRISEGYLKEYSKDISNYLNSKGLKELYGYYEIKKVTKYSYLVVIGFTLPAPNNKFRSNIYYNNIRFKIIPLSILTLLSILSLFIFF
jgi:hypothetical protein